MKLITTILKNYFDEIINDLFEGYGFSSEITQTNDSKFGHYQCNSALKIGKLLGQNPRGVAESIIAKWPYYERVEAIEIAGPGFINITLSMSFLSKELTELAKDFEKIVEPKGVNEKIIIEFSSPNVAKELHVGHLRSTIIGECLSRLFERLGYNVLRLNHIGDWGTQFGMLIAYLKEFNEISLNNESFYDLSQLMIWYKESKKLFDSDASFKVKAQQNVVKLQSGDTETVELWKAICSISRNGFNEIYDILDVDLEERGESFYNGMLPQIIKEFENKNLITISDGAKCVFLEGFSSKSGGSLPLILQKSDGGYNYATTDTAAIKQRVDIEKAKKIFYVVDSGQKLHFQMVFQAALKADIFDEKHVQLCHIPFGVVLGQDGKKFKTRSGETEKLLDLINKAIDRAKELLKERLPQINDNELVSLAKTLGLNAIKYSDLSCHRTKDYVFSYDRMLRFEGNTAAYLMYSYVRIQSIKRKCKKIVNELVKSTPIQLIHPSEQSLGLKLRQFGEALFSAKSELLPNRICDYLYTLAELFHAFFRDCRVEGSKNEDSRLVLLHLTSNVMKEGMHILGLKTMDKM